MYKLYTCKLKNSNQELLFEGERLISSNKFIFYRLLELHNKEIKKFNKISEDAEQFFGREMPRSSIEQFDLDNIEIVELTETEIYEMFAPNLSRELCALTEKLTHPPTIYVPADKLKDVPFGEMYVTKRRKHRRKNNDEERTD